MMLMITEYNCCIQLNSSTMSTGSITIYITMVLHHGKSIDEYDYIVTILLVYSHGDMNRIM